ncbi:unnamed protein product [Didymodactylos carnosus]|uniref:Uncharacterized protein n=1 Tax=Didymodactylos carnosus TaxID=1234261 RepID=A0A815QZK2_9BILA|nr:unnamed protein product [Didymodactylos carnosus]CAF4337088.1 unnamed protein product [Didymodactylos carnosus]
MKCMAIHEGQTCVEYQDAKLRETNEDTARKDVEHLKWPTQGPRWGSAGRGDTKIPQDSQQLQADKEQKGLKRTLLRFAIEQILKETGLIKLYTIQTQIIQLFNRIKTMNDKIIEQLKLDQESDQKQNELTVWYEQVKQQQQLLQTVSSQAS